MAGEKTLARNDARRYKQVVAQLDAYKPAWELLTLTWKEYTAHLAALCVERDTFLLQTLLLLRPHHVGRHELPAVGEQLILTIHQDNVA